MIKVSNMIPGLSVKKVFFFGKALLMLIFFGDLCIIFNYIFTRQ